MFASCPELRVRRVSHRPKHLMTEGANQALLDALSHIASQSLWVCLHQISHSPRNRLLDDVK
jgi:hypothetical protein